MSIAIESIVDGIYEEWLGSGMDFVSLLDCAESRSSRAVEGRSLLLGA